MICQITPAYLCDPETLSAIAESFTKPGSDFNRKLTSGEPLGVYDGLIAVVRSRTEIIGWARSETWMRWDTLESFVSPSHRGRGIAAFAASGLRSTYSHTAEVAVFHPHMLLVARRAGFRPVLFEKEGDQWSKVR
jgi:GNAT superfamily N-acetyltransferase